MFLSEHRHLCSSQSYRCRHFLTSSRFHVERAIPSALLQQAAGYAILSVVKVGMGWSAAVGTGLVVARREDGSWSPPSAVGLSSFGWGIQAGGELTDLLLVLSSTETVKVCCASAALAAHVVLPAVIYSAHDFISYPME